MKKRICFKYFIFASVFGGRLAMGMENHEQFFNTIDEIFVLELPNTHVIPSKVSLGLMLKVIIEKNWEPNSVIKTSELRSELRNILGKCTRILHEGTKSHYVGGFLKKLHAMKILNYHDITSEVLEAYTALPKPCPTNEEILNKRKRKRTDADSKKSRKRQRTGSRSGQTFTSIGSTIVPEATFNINKSSIPVPEVTFFKPQTTKKGDDKLFRRIFDRLFGNGGGTATKTGEGPLYSSLLRLFKEQYKPGMELNALQEALKAATTGCDKKRIGQISQFLKSMKTASFIKIIDGKVMFGCHIEFQRYITGTYPLFDLYQKTSNN